MFYVQIAGKVFGVYNLTLDCIHTCVIQKPHTFLCLLREGADKSLARPGRKQATATNLGIYSTYSPTKLNTLLSPSL